MCTALEKTFGENLTLDDLNQLQNVITWHYLMKRWEVLIDQIDRLFYYRETHEKELNDMAILLQEIINFICKTFHYQNLGLIQDGNYSQCFGIQKDKKIHYFKNDGTIYLNGCQQGDLPGIYPHVEYRFYKRMFE